LKHPGDLVLDLAKLMAMVTHNHLVEKPACEVTIYSILYNLFS